MGVLTLPGDMLPGSVTPQCLFPPRCKNGCDELNAAGSPAIN